MFRISPKVLFKEIGAQMTMEISMVVGNDFLKLSYTDCKFRTILINKSIEILKIEHH